jgi:hypothetical protein
VVCGSQLPPWRDILRAVHPPHSKSRFIMAIRFYGDESEDKQEQVHAVAGWVGKAEEWEHLHGEWISRVKPTGVSAYHMTDCECGGGEFKNWLKPERDQLTIDLIEMICRHNIFLFGMGILLEDYKSLPPLSKEEAALGHDRWHLAFQGVIHTPADVMDGFPPEETIAFFFDWKTKQGVANDVFDYTKNEARLGPWHKRLGTLTFGHKEFDVPGSIPLLQVADIAAVETRKYYANPITHPHLKDRKSLLRLKEAGRIWSLKCLDKPVLDVMREAKREELGLPNNLEQAERALDALNPQRIVRPHNFGTKEQA